MKLTKYILIIVLMIWGSQLCSQEFSEDDQRQIDSLNSIISNASSHDTSIVAAYVLTSYILLNFNADTSAILYVKAKVIADRTLSSNPPTFIKKSLLNSLVSGLNNLGYDQWSKRNFSRAAEYYISSLKIARKLRDKKIISAILFNVGVNYTATGNLLAGLDYHSKDFKIRKEINDKQGMAKSLFHIAGVYNKQGDFSHSMKFYNKSLLIEEELGNKTRIGRVFNAIAYLYHKHGDISQALVIYMKNLKIMEKLGSGQGLAMCLNNIAGIYYQLGDFSTSLDYYNKSLKVSEEIGNQKGVAQSLGNMAVIYKSQGNSPKALESDLKSLKIREKLKDKYGIALSLNNIAGIYRDQGKITQALEYLQKSLILQEEIGNKTGIAHCLNNIGRIYYKKDNFIKAEIYTKRSMKLSKKLGYPELLMFVSQNLYDIYVKTKKFQNALYMYELHIQMRDSIKNETTQKAGVKQQMQYEYEKQHLADSLETSKELALKDIEISKQHAEAKAERTTKYGLFGGLSLVLIIALVLFRSVNQKKKVNEEILAQKKEVEESKLHIEALHKEVTDSIHYAAHIQNAILTSDAYWQKMLDNHFILFKPRDIVSGDFYWAYETPSKKKIWIAADCTGHGVPGGFMSMLGNTFLNEIVIEQGEENASEILNKLRDHIIKALASDVGNEEGLEMKDGMDLALCILHSNNILEYSGANNPLWVLSVREGLSEGARTTHNEAKNMFLHEIKADKQPIGKYTQMTPFTSHKIQLEKGDQVYTFTDGFPDQFGGPKLKKYMRKKLKKFLLSIADNSMEEQKKLLLSEFENWRKDTEQVDDVCVIGVRV